MKFNEMNQNAKNTVKKLQLKKETIKVLHGPELSLVAGGIGPTNSTTEGITKESGFTKPDVSCVCGTIGDSCNCDAGVTAKSWCPCTK